MAHARFVHLLLACSAAALLAQANPAGPGANPLIDDLVRVTVPGSVHPRLARLVPTGVVAADQPMERMILALKMDPGAKARMDQLLRDQQDPRSPRFHQWLTPDQFGAQFGAPKAQLDAATTWLTSQGFTVHGAARGGLSISFSGTAAQVGKAFRTAIVEYDVDGVKRHGNATPISLPAGLASFAAGVVSLHDIPHKSAARRLGPMVRKSGSRPAVRDLSYGNDVGPWDFAYIYNLQYLFKHTPITGTGVHIRVVCRCEPDMASLAQFKLDFTDGISTPTTFTGSAVQHVNGPDPGVTSFDEQFEANLDTQWTTATAPGATIDYVVSASSFATDGVDLSAQYIVDNVDTLHTYVMTTSFTECEQDLGGPDSAANLFWQNLWAQAASEGISAFVATGDSGGADCDDPSAATGTALAVSGLASTPYNTAVGGTEFLPADNTTPWWSTSVTGFQTSATEYVPEMAWNESGAVAGGSGLAAGGGGASTLYAMPTWQWNLGSTLGAPHTPDSRLLPDVSFTSAAQHNPLIAYEADPNNGNTQTPFLGGGTSFASPAMAGIMALVVQNTGQPQGNANWTLYRLGLAQYSHQTGAPTVFHDITSSSNIVPINKGYNAGPAYDMATGLGSLDANALVNNWTYGTISSNPLTTFITMLTNSEVASGTIVTFNGYSQGSSNVTLTWNFGDGTSLTPYIAGTPTTHTYYNTQVGPKANTSQTFNATLTAFDGSWTQSTTVIITVTPGTEAILTLPVANVGALPGVPVNFAGTAVTYAGGGVTLQSATLDFGDLTTPSTITVSGQLVNFGPNTSQPISHTYTNPGDPYTVTLTVTDNSVNPVTSTATLSLWVDIANLDAAGNLAIDVRDLLVICGYWSPVQATYLNFNGVNFFADMNADGVVNDTDIYDWLDNFTPGMAY